MKIKTFATVVTLVALTMIGCRSNPIYTVADAPVVTSTRDYSTKDVRNAILQAGASLGWQMNDAQPGLIVGTLNVRDHMVQVDIPYDRRTYSILYRGSANMNYDGGNIHSNYTGWVQRLNAAINSRLSML
jgi:hypothetical protein